MDDQNKNLIFATVLSFLVIVAWFVLFPPEQQAPQEPPELSELSEQELSELETGRVAPASPSATTENVEAPTPEEPDAERIAIETPALSGSISTLGGRIDQLALKRYREDLDPDSPNVELLSPVGEPDAYYALFGWAPGGSLDYEDVPGADTRWRVVEGETLSPGSPITLGWDNGEGLTFRRTIAVDEDYMFTVEQSVENRTDEAVRMAPYGVVSRHGEPDDLSNFFILHEGVVRMTDGELQEIDYGDLAGLEPDDRWGPSAEVLEAQNEGWVGFTDKYWMTTLVPDGPFISVAQYLPGSDIYRTEAREATIEIMPGETAQQSTRLFAGAKEWETIRHYQNEEGINGFVDSIDWGWFFFLTKPIFVLLHWLNGVIGNMGWSIIVLTLMIKAVLFPLAYKSYVSMAKMKELQPEMEKLKEKAGDDRQKLQQGMMALYRDNKVNPASGCLPILLQIPIFFSLYKVIFVTLELRHAPWIGWIHDLSAPDPTSILNLFGLLPYAPPDPSSFLAILSLGVLPILLGISMWLQQKLNPAPADATQAMIFAWMPWVFMFMLGQFAAGLVLYWIANNMITFTQQYAIMRSQGYKPDVFGNIRKGLSRSKG